MIDAVRVSLWGKTVGAVAFGGAGSGASDAARQGACVFEFDPRFSSTGWDIAPRMMPLGALRNRRLWSFPALNPDTWHGLPGLLADSLPDRFGNALIDRYMAEKGIRKEDITVLDRLSYMGKRGMGALEFAPAQAVGRPSRAPLDLADLVAEARNVLFGRLDDEKARKETLKAIMRVGTSAGGARAKAVIAFNPATREVRSGQLDADEGFEHWLLKFDGMGRDDELGSGEAYGRIEYAYSLMARSAGMHMSDCRLLEENGRAHFMTRRFDRVDGKKLHMQSLCAIEHLDFNCTGTHSYQQLVRLILDLQLGYSVASEAYRRMVFNVLSKNRDDHTKNFSFLMDETGAWSLAPAYDVMFAHNPAGKWTSRHQMAVNGKFVDIKETDLLEEAAKLGIPGPRGIIAGVRDAVERWPEFAREAGVPAAVSEYIGRLTGIA